MLEEFESAADGMINLSVIDPLPFSEEEDRAAQFGLQAIPLPSSPDPVYLGLAATDSVDNEETIPFFQPDKESFLEYDIAKLVSTLANPERTVIGLVTNLEMSGGFDPQRQSMNPPWVVYQQASQLFEVRNLGTTFADIAGRSQPAVDRAAARSQQRHALCDRPVHPERRASHDLRRPGRRRRSGSHGRHAAGNAADGPGFGPGHTVRCLGCRILVYRRRSRRRTCITDQHRAWTGARSATTVTLASAPSA